MLAALVLVACCTLAASQTTIGTGITNFGLDFYKECVQEHPGDVVISPLSVSTVLSLLSQAAKGKTYEQLQKRLFPNIEKNAVAFQYRDLFKHLQIDSKDSVLALANEIFVQKGHEINPIFQKTATVNFLSNIEALNFGESKESANIINDFVKNKTKNKIIEIVKPYELDANTEMVLLNAIYFKASWENKFDEKLTKKDKFYVTPTESKEIDFMHTTANFGYVYSNELNSAVLEMNYAKSTDNSSYSFVIILPDEGVQLSTVEAKLNSNVLNDLLSGVFPASVDVKIPKFGVEYEIDLRNVLQKLNLGEMFESSSDLNGLFKDKTDLKVSKATHKAVIEVNEEGSTAAGVSAVGIQFRSGMDEETFVANRPFMYLIRDTERNTIIFSGRLESLNSTPAYLTADASHFSMSYIIVFASMILVGAFNSKMM